MTADEIAKAAWRGQALPDFGDLDDMHLHTCLLRVYADFKAGKIDKEKADALKKRLVASWDDDKKTSARWRELIEQNTAAIKACEGLNPDKAETVGECIGILAKMVAAATGDSSLPERMRKKWG